jgi:hypothetical protein
MPEIWRTAGSFWRAPEIFASDAAVNFLICLFF